MRLGASVPTGVSTTTGAMSPFLATLVLLASKDQVRFLPAGGATAKRCVPQPAPPETVALLLAASTATVKLVRPSQTKQGNWTPKRVMGAGGAKLQAKRIDFER